MSISDVAIRRPVFTSMLALCLIVLGGFVVCADVPSVFQSVVAPDGPSLPRK